MNLSRLLFIHGIITLGAGIILVVFPALIPGMVNIDLTADKYLLCYFLAAAEWAVAYLSFFSRKIKDKYSLQTISMSFIIFHAATGILEFYAITQGASSKIIGNIILRIIAIILLYYYGILRIKKILLE